MLVFVVLHRERKRWTSFLFQNGIRCDPRPGSDLDPGSDSSPQSLQDQLAGVLMFLPIRITTIG